MKALAPLVLALPLLATLPDRITPVARHRLDRVGLEIVSGELQLPARLRQATLRAVPGPGLLQGPCLVPAEAPAPRHRRKVPLPSGEDRLAMKVYARLLQPAPKGTEALLDLVDAQGNVLQRLRFPLPTHTSPDPEPVQGWAAARLLPLGGPLKEALVASARSAYGLSPDLAAVLLPDTHRRGARDTSPSLLSLLGGRAAVDETLQLDRELEPAAGGAAQVPLSRLRPVATPAHPWAEMRRGKTPEVPLADLIPRDRAVLFLPRPQEALASLEEGGAAFLARVASFSGEGAMETSVVSRTLESLGLGRGLGRQLVALGAIRHVALFFPDLQFATGTETTLVAELAPTASALLPIPEGPVHVKATPQGEAYWTRRGARILLSTSRRELERALALAEGRAQDALGGSDEFAVVLQHLAPGPATEAFAYLPDAFIRDLVGPRQRILQARQTLARRQMEGAAAAALLRRMDAPQERPTLADLKRLGYLPPAVAAAPLRLDETGRIRHGTFGPLDHPTPLARLPLEAVTAAEAQAYEAFRDTYDQYWRKYFDPIAFRLDSGPQGELTLDTFVLPLLEHSLYAPFRAFLPPGEPALIQPCWGHPMVATFAMTVSPEGLDQFQRTVANLTGSPVALPFTGAVAVAFPDAAPVVQLGGGSPATLLDGRLGRDRGLLGMASLALGAFTRPMVLAFELTPGARPLDDLAPLPLPSRDLGMTFSQEPDGRRLVHVDFLGLVGLRFTLRQEGRWLVVTNDPGLPATLVAGDEPPTPFHAALHLHPDKLRLGLPALWQATMDGEARAAWSAMDWLSPWLATGMDLQEAQAASLRLLGQAPSVAPGDLDMTGGHRRFGTPRKPLRPAFDPDRDFGLLEGVREPRVEVRLEGEGLRARITWRR